MKQKKNNKQGFTLVEIIVVLVILAILAAILIPSMVGYIKKANEKKNLTEARNVVQACQTYVDEHIKDVYQHRGGVDYKLNSSAKDGSAEREIMDLAEMPASWTGEILVSTATCKVWYMKIVTDDNVITYNPTGLSGVPKGWNATSK
mgnify:CR=1 FL=1